MNQLMKKRFAHLGVVGVCVSLFGCAATQTVLEHGSLQVNTKQSDTIFLVPVSASQKTIFVEVKNTSDEIIHIHSSLKSSLSQRGYRVVSNPQNAHYLLQTNVRMVGKMSEAASQSSLAGGYGSAIAGGVVGTAVGGLTHTGTGLIAGGLAGGVLGMAADSLVKNINYTMVTDVQVSERVGKGVIVKENANAHLKNGSSSVISQNVTRNSQFQQYRTRIVSNANKVNLKFAEARPALEKGLVKVISGIF